MLNSVNGKIGAIMVSAMALIIPSNVSANEIALTFDDHGFTVLCEFMGFEKESYVVMTTNGEMIVPVQMVSCVGQDCFESAKADLDEG